ACRMTRVSDNRTSMTRLPRLVRFRPPPTTAFRHDIESIPASRKAKLCGASVGTAMFHSETFWMLCVHGESDAATPTSLDPRTHCTIYHATAPTLLVKRRSREMLGKTSRFIKCALRVAMTVEELAGLYDEHGAVVWSVAKRILGDENRAESVL